MRRKLFNTVITVTVLTVLLLLYGLSFYLNTPRYWESVVLTTLVYAVFTVAVVLFIPHLTSLLAGDEQQHLIRQGDRTFRRCGTRELAKLILAIMAFRLIEILLTYLIHYAHFGYERTFLEVQRVWLDFYHVETAFPLYGYLSQVFWIFTFNFNHARFIGSFVFTAFAGAALYALVLFDFNRKNARRAVRFLYLLPISCLLLGTVPDGLFLLLSILALYFMRKRLFAIANAFAMLAVTTHAIGLLLFFPILAEYIAYLIANSRSNREMGKRYLVKQVLNSLSFVLIPIGFVLVLLYASLRFGDAFVLYRSAFGSFQITMPGALFEYFDSVVESTKTILPDTIPMLCVTVLPQILYLFGVCVLIMLGSGRIDTSYVLLMVLIVPLVLMTGRIDSAAAWITILAPVYIAIAASVQKRWTNYLLLILFGGSWILYFYAFIIGFTGASV